jgi:hypothetical protein
MRRIAVLALVVVSMTAAGCALVRSDKSATVETTAQADRADIEGAAEAPLRDLNVLRTKIPPVLLEALVDPYARPPRSARITKAQQCAALVSLIQPLDDALGADLDNPDKEDKSLIYRGKDAALGMMAGAASDMIPFRSWVRKLSGAERHDKLVQNAISAGAVRRAYLKGLGEAHGCNPPATPSHALTETVDQRPPPSDHFLPLLYPNR